MHVLCQIGTKTTQKTVFVPQNAVLEAQNWLN
jgi:hypothetical protein